MDQEVVNVYLDDKPVGIIKIRDGQLLAYPLQKDKAHITTQNLNEIIAFFQRQRD